MRISGDFQNAALRRLHDLGGEVLVQRIVRLFDGFVAERVVDATAAESTGDYARVAAAAHAVRSSAGNVGAADLMAVATELEQAARAGRDDVPVLVIELQRAFAGARLELREFIPGGVA